jgi:hypothetical protein
MNSINVLKISLFLYILEIQMTFSKLAINLQIKYY